MSNPPLSPPSLMTGYLNTSTGTSAYAANNQGVPSSASGDWVGGSMNLTSAITNCSRLTTMFVMIGTNDSKNALQTTPATYMSNIQSTITALETAGFTKIVLNYSPWIVYPNSAGGFGSGSDALLMQYQTQLQALAAADPTHVFIGDTAAFTYFQANPSQLQDGVHPTNAGYAVLAQLWATASLNIIGATLPVPVISGVASGNVTTMAATITWTTAQPSSSQVEYGTTASYGSLSTLNSSPVTSHSVTLSGLTPGTNYNYAVLSATPAGTATSANFTFSTPAIPLNSTITVVGGARNNTGASITPASLSIPYSSSNGNTIVAVCALGSSSSSISSITDGASVWTFQAGVNNGTAVRSEIWSTGVSASVASTSFTINISGGTPASCALEEYAGVLHLGATATNSATSGTISVSLPMPEAKDYVVVGLGANSYNGYNISTGTLRQAGGLTQNQSSNYVEMDLCDNTAATATTVGCASVSASAPWAAPALVLRTQ
jgi:lysophospholipase L1-like esterase